MRSRIAGWLFRVAYKIDHRRIGEEAVGIAPMYRVAMRAEARYDGLHRLWVSGVPRAGEPVETRLP